MWPGQEKQQQRSDFPLPVPNFLPFARSEQTRFQLASHYNSSNHHHHHLKVLRRVCSVPFTGQSPLQWTMSNFKITRSAATEVGEKLVGCRICYSVPQTQISPFLGRPRQGLAVLLFKKQTQRNTAAPNIYLSRTPDDLRIRAQASWLGWTESLRSLLFLLSAQGMPLCPAEQEHKGKEGYVLRAHPA